MVFNLSVMFIDLHLQNGRNICQSHGKLYSIQSVKKNSLLLIFNFQKGTAICVVRKHELRKTYACLIK